ncbi:MAG: hypothetical protein ACRCXZ_03105 [Patescibacteria group bacterium]
MSAENMNKSNKETQIKKEGEKRLKLKSFIKSMPVVKQVLAFRNKREQERAMARQSIIENQRIPLDRTRVQAIAESTKSKIESVEQFIEADLDTTKEIKSSSIEESVDALAKQGLYKMDFDLYREKKSIERELRDKLKILTDLMKNSNTPEERSVIRSQFQTYLSSLEAQKSNLDDLVAEYKAFATQFGLPTNDIGVNETKPTKNKFVTKSIIDDDGFAIVEEQHGPRPIVQGVETRIRKGETPQEIIHVAERDSRIKNFKKIKNKKRSTELKKNFREGVKKQLETAKKRFEETKSFFGELGEKSVQGLRDAHNSVVENRFTDYIAQKIQARNERVLKEHNENIPLIEYIKTQSLRQKFDSVKELFLNPNLYNTEGIEDWKSLIQSSDDLYSKSSILIQKEVFLKEEELDVLKQKLLEVRDTILENGSKGDPEFDLDLKAILEKEEEELFHKVQLIAFQLSELNEELKNSVEIDLNELGSQTNPAREAMIEYRNTLDAAKFRVEDEYQRISVNLKAKEASLLDSLEQLEKKSQQKDDMTKIVEKDKSMIKDQLVKVQSEIKELELKTKKSLRDIEEGLNSINL